MRIELLYFDGCPGYEALLAGLPGLLAAEGIVDDIELRRIESAEDARRERFLGSPTVRIDGNDVDANAESREDFGLKCRLYRTRDGYARVPPEEWVRAALADAR